ncbi:hypothetical protein MTO96_002505 [Rhipicephalus appendiculatus]
MQMSDLEGKVGSECSISAFFPAPYATTQLGTRGPEKRTDLMVRGAYVFHSTYERHTRRSPAASKPNS